MTDEQLIVRLTRELYDLKAKLSVIESHADKAYKTLYADDKPNTIVLNNVIDICNLCSEGAIYE